MIENREHWRRWVTPGPIRSAAIHRWYCFPHSFTGELVHALIDEWELNSDDRILDPFVGAGTTLVAAKQRSLNATGYDLSPLAVFVSSAKSDSYQPDRLKKLVQELEKIVPAARGSLAENRFPDLVRRALPRESLKRLLGVDQAISGLRCSQKYQRLLKLALLAIIPRYSRAVATGGWLRWVENCENSRTIPTAFIERLRIILEDVENSDRSRITRPLAQLGDARSLSDSERSYSAVITSPPYPNRHDYTRVFGVELMFAFLDWEGTRDVRYQSIHSHPEARPIRPNYDDYVPPASFIDSLSMMEQAGIGPKIKRMLEGYFLDMHLCLKESRRVVKRGGHIGFVVGNARYKGVPLLVDEIIGEIGTSLGLTLERIIAVRFRGNSAQQMGTFGRVPSRESVVVFRRR